MRKLIILSCFLLLSGCSGGGTYSGGSSEPQVVTSTEARPPEAQPQTIKAQGPWIPPYIHKDRPWIPLPSTGKDGSLH